MRAFQTLRTAALAVLLCPLLASTASAVEARYNFTAGNRAPVITGDSGGVTFSNFSTNALNLSAETNDALRIYGTGLGTDTRAAITANRQLAFTVTIPSGTTVNFKTLSISFTTTYTGSTVTNARVFSEIQGDDNLTADTIGVVGKQASENPPQTGDTLNLENPVSNPGRGTNVTSADFANLTGRSVTFRFPWLSSANPADYIDITQVWFTFDVVGAPPVAPSLTVTDFRMIQDNVSQITLTGTPGNPFSVFASSDLNGPLYRKRWAVVGGGVFDENLAVKFDPDAALHSKRFYIAAAVSEQPKARILPVGDSITEGGTGVIYRPGLFDKLTNAGYHFQFVGSKSTTYNSPVAGTVVTLNHEGYSGKNATEVAAILQGIAPSYPADIVLIHAGHNYNTSELTLTPTQESDILNAGEAAIRSMAASVRAANPKVTILVAQVIPAGKLPKYSYIPALNVRYAQVAASLDTPTSRVMTVNQADGFVWQTDTVTDMVHPNSQGAAKMATKWFDALVSLLE